MRCTSSGFFALGLGLALAAAGGCGSEPSLLGSVDEELSAAQCDYFAVDGRVQICHATGSRTRPYTILKVAEAACVSAHANHPGDYVAVGDPSCQGGGCLPADAPCDATLPCCDGLTCEAGTCVALERPPAASAVPDADHFAWQGVDLGRAADGSACGGVVTTGMGDQALCYAGADGGLRCAGRVFETTWGPSFVDTGLDDVEQVFISPTFNSATGNAMCVKKANGTVWCMGGANNAIFGYPNSGETSATFVQWGTATDVYRIATGTWDQLCAFHTDGSIDCSGYGFGGSFRAPVAVAGPGHHSLWVTEWGTASIDDAATYRVQAGRSTCQVTAAGLACSNGNTSGTPGDVVDGALSLDGKTCRLDGEGRAFCGGGCGGEPWCSSVPDWSCGYYSGCHVTEPQQHFTSAPVLQLATNPYHGAVCGVLNDGSLWCFGPNDRMGQGMLGTGGTGDLAVDTMVAPPGSVRLPSCR